MLAPNLPTASPLRAALTALAQPAGADTVAAVAATTPPPGITPPAAVIAAPLHRHAARYAWALLRARLYAVCPLRCPKCGGELRSIAFITAAAAVRDILRHRGEPSTPQIGRASCRERVYSSV